jgi:hypothetical protein
MANQIILKRSSTPSKVPTTAQLALGELAINTYDGKIYVKKDNGATSVVEIGGVTSVNTLTGDVVLSTSDVTEGSNQYFTTSRARSALSAGTGISYNSGTGIISTAQNLTSAGSPTFAGLTLTGSMGITGNIIPSSDITYDLGSPTAQWKDIYVGPGSLYVNGSKVLQDDTGTITFSADTDQNIRIKTTGSGILQLGSSTTTLQVDSTLQMTAGKRITSSDGVKVQFGDDIELNNNKIIGVGAPSSSTDAATKGYVDTAISAVSTSSIAQGNSNIAVVDTGTGTVTVTVDGSTALTVDASGVVVAGNFTVSGTTTTVNSNTVAIADNIVTLNSDATGTPTQNAGVEVERGDEANVQLRWNEGSDKWTFTNDGAVYFPLAVDTNDLTEGSSNLYFTNTRARTSLSVASGAGISYNSSTGVFNLSGIPNSSLANNSVNVNGSVVSLGGSISIDTDAVSEGANKYFSNALARAAISVSGSLAYNSTTGVISYTTPSTTGIIEGTNLYFTDARARSAVSASTGLTYNSSTGAFTIDSTVTTLTGTQTLTNKTLTSPTINGATVGGHLVPATDIVYDLGSETKRFRDLYLSGSTIKLGDATISASPTGSLTLGGTGGSGTVVTSDANGDFTAGTITAALVGNATTATTLATARTISGTSFNGSANITLTTAGITEATNLYYTDARVAARVSSGLSNFHATFQSVTSAQATTNVSSTVAYTFADLATAEQYNVYLNRMLLRPTEFTVSGSTLTIAAGMLSTDDEIEVTGLKFA